MSEKIEFTEDRLKKVEAIIGRYPADRKKSALLPVLHLAQEQYGWVSSARMDYVAG